MLSSTTYPVIIPAAGIGSRMQASCAKQYLKINDKTVLEHTVNSFLDCPLISDIIIVLHPEDVLFETLSIANNPTIKTVVGGNERVDSVLQGLKALSAPQQQDWVLVHDAARPCLHQEDLAKLVQSCKTSEYAGGILAVPVADTIKRGGIADTITATVDRSMLWQAQTPQMFIASQLINAIEANYNSNGTMQSKITDEASAMEMSGFKVSLIEGRSSNIKITRPSDLQLAAFYLSQAHKGSTTQ